MFRPSKGMLAAPLVGSDGRNMGVIYLSDRNEEAISPTRMNRSSRNWRVDGVNRDREFHLRRGTREANRMKDEFLATLSHELRTPLNAILGWTQLLATEKLESEVSHGLEVIERNARAQTKLIEDLLEVSRITTGKLKLTIRATFTSRPVIEAAADAVRPAAAAKGLDFQSRFGRRGQGNAHGDADRLQQVFWNLLANAVKFTPKRRAAR